MDELWHRNINKEIFCLGLLVCVSCGCSDLMTGTVVLPYWVSFGIDLALFSLPISSAREGGALGERGRLCGETHLRPGSEVFGSGSIFVFMTFYFLFLSIFCRSHSFVWSVDVSLVWQVEGGARVIDCDIATLGSSSGKFNLTGDRHCSSFLNPSTDSRYVSQVSFSSFIFCTCIAYHSIKVKTLVS